MDNCTSSTISISLSLPHMFKSYKTEDTLTALSKRFDSSEKKTTDLGHGSEMIILKSILATFEASTIF
jgi:hypothetical protein